MSDRILSTIGLQMTDDFPIDSYKAVHERVCSNSNTESELWSEYAGAWNAIAYRFQALTDHGTAFSESIRRSGDGPPQPERYIQERELFAFFINGLATIESFCYGLFSIGSIVDSVAFPVATPKDLKLINVERTGVEFKKTFPGKGVTMALERLIDSNEYAKWKEIRNILAHRSAPGRIIYLSSGSPAAAAQWKIGIPLDETTTKSRREWLAKTLGVLLQDTDDFTKEVFS